MGPVRQQEVLLVIIKGALGEERVVEGGQHLMFWDI